MLFDGVLARAQTDTLAFEQPVSFRFDWDAKAYVMDSGSPQELSGVDSAKAWLEQCIRTRKGKYELYPLDYGCSALDFIGKKFVGGVAIPTLEGELQAAAKYCDEIRSIGRVRVENNAIVLDVMFSDASEETIEVIPVEP